MMPKSVSGVMKEWKEGKLHSGSKSGPVVRSRKQAVAIALSEQGVGYGRSKGMKKKGSPASAGDKRKYKIRLQP